MSENMQRDDEIVRAFPGFGYRPMFKVAIRRVEPKWCAGYQGTIDVDDQEDISFESIRDEFGGGRFYLKIQDSYGRYLAHRSMKICGEPRVNGCRIYKEQKIDNPKKLLSQPDNKSTEDIAALRGQIAALTAQVEKLVKQGRGDLRKIRRES